MATPDDQVRTRFTRRYAIGSPDVMAQIEQRVIGGDWGSSGYTTREQADELAAHLRLDATQRLLDIGSGRGWPGLYLAAATGCEAVLMDLPHEALVASRRRAAEEGVTARVNQVVASAAAMPLRWGTFDGIVHTDVLC